MDSKDSGTVKPTNTEQTGNKDGTKVVPIRPNQQATPSNGAAPPPDSSAAASSGAPASASEPVPAADGQTTGLDWATIEREYRAGVLSVRKIAKAAGCSESTIREKAQRFGWKRNLAGEIRNETRRKIAEMGAAGVHSPAGGLNREALPNPDKGSGADAPDNQKHGTQENETARALPAISGGMGQRGPVEEEEVIERASSAAAAVVVDHQQAARIGAHAIRGLLTQLKALSVASDDVLASMCLFIGEEVKDGLITKADAVNMRKALNGILSLPGLAKSARDLTASLKTLTEIERQAHAIDEKAQDSGGDTYEERLARLADAGRVDMGGGQQAKPEAQQQGEERAA